MLEGEQGHQDSLLRTENSVKAIVNLGIVVDKLANDTANRHRSQGTIKNDANAQAQAMLNICYALSTGGGVRQNVKLRRDKYVFIDYTPIPLSEK